MATYDIRMGVEKDVSYHSVPHDRIKRQFLSSAGGQKCRDSACAFGAKVVAVWIALLGTGVHQRGCG